MCSAGMRRRGPGFTLVELLVVIAIVAVLASILLPVLAHVKKRTMVMKARQEIQALVAAIKAYEGDYNRHPCSPAAEKVSAGRDFTFGTSGVGLSGSGSPIENGLGYETNNSEVVTILLAADRGANLNHARNTRKTRYLEARMVSGRTAGVSLEDYVARDPWGGPYFITFDMNDDGRCLDAYYRRALVSERQVGDNVGFYGLSRAQAGDNFEVSGSVMIWSAGLDQSYNPQEKANTGVNKDNVLSWGN